MIGDTVTQPARFAFSWNDCPADAQVRVIVNGRLLRQQSASVRGAMEWNMTPEQANWVVVEIRDGNGALRAITNPIFLDNR